MSTVTQDDLARLTGVSKSTISRIINQSPRVAPDVAKLVRNKISEMGYEMPAPRAPLRMNGRRGSANGQIMLLVLGETLAHGYGISGYPALFAGIDAAARDNGLNLMLSGLTPHSPLPAALESNDLEGVLLFGDVKYLSTAALAALSGLPAVGVMRGFDQLSQRLDRVTYDNTLVGPMAADYLISRGHKRVGFFNIDPEHSAMSARQQSFTAAASAAGVEVIPFVAPTKSHDFREEMAMFRGLVSRMCRGLERVPACFVAHDLQIPPIYQVLDALSVEPGRDVELIGCDNAALHLDRLSPRPATLDINLELVGRRSVEQLLWRMANPDVKNRSKITIEPTLVPAEA